MNETDPPIRLRDAMPRPLLVVFALAAIVALGASMWVLVRPPAFGEVGLAERRPAPGDGFSHDPVGIFPAPTPDAAVAFEAPCAAVEGARPLGGPSFVGRVAEALESACTLQGASIGAETRRAVGGFAGATIRIAQFERSGIESTVDLEERTIWVNLPLTRRTTPVAHLVPVLLHEAWHLLGAPVTARTELTARAVELEACRQFIRRAEWPRWCYDADALLALDPERAIELLAAAGYPRAVSSGP